MEVGRHEQPHCVVVHVTSLPPHSDSWVFVAAHLSSELPTYRSQYMVYVCSVPLRDRASPCPFILHGTGSHYVPRVGGLKQGDESAKHQMNFNAVTADQLCFLVPSEDYKLWDLHCRAADTCCERQQPAERISD